MRLAEQRRRDRMSLREERHGELVRAIEASIKVDTSASPAPGGGHTSSRIATTGAS